MVQIDLPRLSDLSKQLRSLHEVIPQTHHVSAVCIASKLHGPWDTDVEQNVLDSSAPTWIASASSIQSKWRIVRLTPGAPFKARAVAAEATHHGG